MAPAARVEIDGIAKALSALRPRFTPNAPSGSETDGPYGF